MSESLDILKGGLGHAETRPRVVIEVEDPDGNAIVNVMENVSNVEVIIRYSDGQEISSEDTEEEEEEDFYEDLEDEDEFDDEDL